MIWLKIPVFCDKIYLTQMKGIGGVFMIKIAIVDDDKFFVSEYQKELKKLFNKYEVECEIDTYTDAFLFFEEYNMIKNTI